MFQKYKIGGFYLPSTTSIELVNFIYTKEFCIMPRMNNSCALFVVFAVCLMQLLEIAISAPNPNPQQSPGLLGTFSTWGNGILDALNLTSNAFANGSAIGFLGIGNGLQNLSNGFINVYNASANGLVDTYQSLTG